MKISWLKGDIICLKKENGGLRVRRPKEFNLALLGKWCQRVLEERETLVYWLIVARYSDEDVPKVRRENMFCLVEEFNSVREGVGLQVGSCWLVDNIWHKVDDGSSTLFSKDSWLEGEPLNTRFSRL